MGAIVGSVVAGFWLVPLLGSQKTLLMGIAVNSLLALGVLLVALPVRLSRYRPVLPVVVLLFCVNLFYSVPSWDPAVMSSSVFRYIRDYAGLTREAFRERAQRIAGEILMFKEGLTCTITIFRNPEVTSLMVNGKPDASTPSGLNPITENSPIDALHDLPTQSLFGHVPLLLAPKIDDVLVIGLGSGVTLGSVMTHPVKHVECIELEDAVVRGDQFFEEFNLRPLSDPRTHLVVNDARNHLLVTDRKYDVIISEPSNPWIPGAASLFTREFFEVSKSKLQPNGVFCQWIQLYELQESHFQTILHTFASVFPEIHVFRVKHDAILLASMRPIKIREMEIRERFTPRVRTDLARIRIKSTEDLLARYWIGGDELRKAVQNEPFNTDDNMLIEFAAPLQVLTAHSRGTRRILAQMFDDRTTAALGQIELDPSTDPALFWARVGQAALRVKSYHEARLYGEASWKLEQNAEAAAVLATGLQARRENERAFALLQEAEKRFPKSPEVLRALALFHSRNSQWKEARPYAERLLVEAPNDPVGLLCLGRSQYYMDEARASVRTFEKILPSDRARPELEDLPFYLGTLYWGEKRYTEVAEQFKIYLKTDPSNIELRAQLADALYHIGKVPEAVLQWQQIGSLNLARANQLVKEAAVASRSGQEQEALRRLDEAVLLDSGNAELVLLLARQKQSQNDTGGAVELLQTYLQWHPDKPIAVGYLSQLLAAQKKQKEALVLAARYRALTGRPWEEIP